MISKRLQPTPIIYAPMPKTASRTLLKSIETGTNARVIEPKSSGGVGHFIINPQSIRRAHLSIIDRKTPIIYSHFLPLKKNLLTLKSHLNIKSEKPPVIVSVRNIFDVAMSCEDHQWKNYGPWGVLKGENDYFSKNASISHSNIWNAIVCIKFYASWMIAKNMGLWDVKLLSYDMIIDQRQKCLEDISQFFKLSLATNQAENIRKNVNKGIKGRGENLDDNARSLLINYAQSFKGIDFSPIGID
jgi:hypothetical protein